MKNPTNNYPIPHHCVSCGKVPSIAASLENIMGYWAMACVCRRMRGPAGKTELEAVIKWNDYQKHCQNKKTTMEVDHATNEQTGHLD